MNNIYNKKTAIITLALLNTSIAMSQGTNWVDSWNDDSSEYTMQENWSADSLDTNSLEKEFSLDLNGNSISGGNITDASVAMQMSTAASLSLTNSSEDMSSISDFTAGVINTSSHISSIDNINFENNYIVGNGSVIYMSSASTIDSISNSEFKSNSSTKSGGVIYNNGGTITSISDSSFVSNKTTTTTAYGGVIYNTGTIGSITNTEFESNSASAAGVIYNNGGTINLIDNVEFLSNKTTSSSSGYGGAIRNTNLIDTISNSRFDSNSATTGGAIYNYGATIKSISDTDFISNSSTKFGGAIYNTGTISSISNAVFESNYVTGSTYGYTGGAAVYSTGTSASVNIIDSTLTNNYATFANTTSSGGGAIYNNYSNITLSTTEGTNIVNSGNYASLKDGIIDADDDAKGGFMYLYGTSSKMATSTFDTAANSSITIGNGTAGYDSIASYNSYATINKTGEGSLIVNSSMEYYTGTLSVRGGTMIVNNVLGANSISVENGASLEVDILNVYLDSSSISNPSIVTVESGSNFTLDSLVIYLYEDFLDTLIGSDFAIIDDESVSVASVSVYYENDVSGTTDLLDSNLYTFENGIFTYLGGTAVPEPSTYAMILGVFALGFAAYRRRK